MTQKGRIPGSRSAGAQPLTVIVKWPARLKKGAGAQ
jgi:hypothetical protein